MQGQQHTSKSVSSSCDEICAPTCAALPPHFMWKLAWQAGWWRLLRFRHVSRAAVSDQTTNGLMMMD